MHEWRYIAVAGRRERQREGAASRGRAELRGSAAHLRGSLAAGSAPPARGTAEEPEPFRRRALTMGCRLCALQKPEEQYKLLYEVCQVKNSIFFFFFLNTKSECFLLGL